MKSRSPLWDVLHNKKRSPIFTDTSELHILSWSEQRAQSLKLHANQYAIWNKSQNIDNQFEHEIRNMGVHYTIFLCVCMFEIFHTIFSFLFFF